MSLTCIEISQKIRISRYQAQRHLSNGLSVSTLLMLICWRGRSGGETSCSDPSHQLLKTDTDWETSLLSLGVCSISVFPNCTDETFIKILKTTVLWKKKYYAWLWCIWSPLHKLLNSWVQDRWVGQYENFYSLFTIFFLHVAIMNKHVGWYVIKSSEKPFDHVTYQVHITVKFVTFNLLFISY